MESRLESMQSLSSMESMKSTERMWIVKSSKGGECQVKCTEVCRPKLTDAVEECKSLNKECIMGQFSDEDKKSCDLKCN